MEHHKIWDMFGLSHLTQEDDSNTAEGLNDATIALESKNCDKKENGCHTIERIPSSLGFRSHQAQGLSDATNNATIETKMFSRMPSNTKPSNENAFGKSGSQQKKELKSDDTAREFNQANMRRQFSGREIKSNCPNRGDIVDSMRDPIHGSAFGHRAQDKNYATSEQANESSKGNKPVHPPYIPPNFDETEEKFFKILEKGENFDSMINCPVEVTGVNVPKEPIQRFEDANLTPRVLENIKKLGYTTLTPVQKWSIPIILEGRDIMASAQTGSGKTAAYLIPVLSSLVNNDNLLRKCTNGNIPCPVVLIISPTRELARQIHVEIRKFSHGTIIKSAAIYGGLDRSYQINQLRGASLVVGTVGRLQDFVRNNKIDLSSVKFLILDEADRMLDLGFHDEVADIVALCGGMQCKTRQTLLFSATFPPEIQKLGYEILNDYIFVTVGMLGQANENIKQIIWKVDTRNKKEKLIEVLKEIGSEKAIVFFQTKRNADALCITLGDFMDKNITAIHGDLCQKEREEAIRFFREGKADVLMATAVAARGLDIEGVKHVINYDLPKDINEYVHRIGRTARCGNTGRALSFFSLTEDLELVGPLVKVLSNAQQEVPKWLENVSLSNHGSRENFSRTCDARRNGRFPVRRPQNDLGNEYGHRAPLMNQQVEEEWM